MNTIPSRRPRENKFLPRLSLAAAITATTSLGGWTNAAPAFDGDPNEITARSEPLTWDIYLIFLLRVLHELYGGDESEIVAGMSPVDAMAVVTSHYYASGTPPTTFLGQLTAQLTCLECATMIRSSSHANEEPYDAFMQTLRDMYADVGGDPGDI